MTQTAQATESTVPPGNDNSSLPEVLEEEKKQLSLVQRVRKAKTQLKQVFNQLHDITPSDNGVTAEQKLLTQAAVIGLEAIFRDTSKEIERVKKLTN